ncbi:hypothetical protein R3P38DRAFT_3220395 [Favolaschia claudopus]|uniref:Uncharacterized protein n=1 Tax=Favolaschia claudopus TaxID=2862362 RepID=A0AAW0A2V3_9AGAR
MAIRCPPPKRNHRLFPPPSIPTASFLASTTSALHPTSDHLTRFECLLDFALATMMIILDTDPGPTLSAHAKGVFHALRRRIDLLDTPAQAPSPCSPTPAPSVMPSTHATYAEAVHSSPDQTAPPKEAKPPVTHSSTPTPAPTTSTPSESDSLTPDLIFRVDTLPAPPSCRPYPAVYFEALAGKTASTALPPAPQQLATEAATTIWNTIQPLLRFPEPYDIPQINVGGGAWHSVIVHNTPLMPAIGEPGYSSDLPGLMTWLRASGVEATPMYYTFLRNKDGPQRPMTAPMRISFASQDDADHLVKHGAVINGSQCRVSHSKTKSRTARSTSPE